MSFHKPTPSGSRKPPSNIGWGFLFKGQVRAKDSALSPARNRCSVASRGVPLSGGYRMKSFPIQAVSPRSLPLRLFSISSCNKKMSLRFSLLRAFALIEVVLDHRPLTDASNSPLAVILVDAHAVHDWASLAATCGNSSYRCCRQGDRPR